ncbi:hypothetical protein BJ875DRAFT_463674 [Amylocarpus encephaloides]|uniref:Tat pathway signal sequence n=1 Tax=Amylocarpus encephaloides TaxID=45428 RepID=A0A9P8C4L2_9HELO|nr:hypothetical protein BJ875DRAFT_463674 [Amylocarpus encephaloides]
MARTSQPSPLLKDLKIEYHVRQFNGSFLQEEIYRKEASPEVDEAWQSLGVDYKSVVIPSDQAALSGFTEDHTQIRPEHGGGYPANVEGLHHLRCLNLLRQGLYYNYDYYQEKQESAFLNGEPILRLHITHCLDILRQQLMCTVDFGVLGRVWWNKKDPTAFPDFNTKHKCLNFEDVKNWAFEHQTPERVPDDYLVPPRDLDIVSEGMS